MYRHLANKAMTTSGQKACSVIDHLITALGGEPGSSTRRALILVDIDQNPGTTQAAIMERLDIHKSALSREVDWLFNYGCILRQDNAEDARTVRLQSCGYAKAALDQALDFFEARHEGLKFLLRGLPLFLKQENPPLRDAQIYMAVFEKGTAQKADINFALQSSPASTTNAALKKLIENGAIKDDGL